MTVETYAGDSGGAGEAFLPGETASAEREKAQPEVPLREYRVCCQSVPPAGGCWAVGALEQVTALVMLFVGLRFRNDPHDINMAVVSSTTDSVLVIAIVAVFAAITCFVAVLFYGIGSEKEKLVFAHLVFQVFRIVAEIVTGIILIFALADEITRDSTEEKKLAGLIYILSDIVIVGVECWFFTIVLSFYRYLKCKKGLEMQKRRKCSTSE